MTSASNEALRRTLFGDLPIEAWPEGDDVAGEPWDAFIAARRHLADGDQDLAIRRWATVAAIDGYESRHRLQAWHFLRSVNVHPDAAIAAQVMGVVAEVAVDGGHDVLAAYDDGRVRYLNHAGGASIIEDAPHEVRTASDALLAVGQGVSDAIGPWEEPALPDLAPGHSRFTMLTPSGHRFGQGADEVLRDDAAAGALFAAATSLLVAVVGLGG